MDLGKFDSFLLEDEEIDIDEELMDKMLDLIMGLNDDSLSDEQADQISEIIDMIDPDDEEVSEVYKKRVKRDLGAARTRRRAYRQKRSKMKLKARRYRRSASGKVTLRKAKRFKKHGRTSTGRRQRKFVGPKLSKIK